jgi:hypothetical protein
MPGHLTSVEPVRKSVTVPAAPPRAFELFTAHIQEWWPLATHSVGAEHAIGIVFGEGVGAAITETLAGLPVSGPGRRRGAGRQAAGSARPCAGPDGPRRRPAWRRR